MPGTITFRPIEANLTHNTDLIGKMNPYCAFIVGDSIFKGQICKKGGKHPHWNDAVTVPIGNQSQVVVELMDKDRFSRDDNIGTFLINLNELQSSGQSSRWYPLTHKNRPAGEILLETTFSGDFGYGQRGYDQSVLNQGFIEPSTMARETVTTIEQPAIIEREVLLRQQAPVEERFIEQRQLPVEERRLYTEQQQFIEPRTFLKEVDVVETRARLENIEVLEPQRVLREVQYTQAVPVTKQIEVVEPQVVMKEVEVIEPRLVTKTIQVVENVPVKKMVEVIESVPRLQEVQTFEPQTFTKQVEVTDYVPVQRQVTVTEPVHMKKAVEFVEPVITTKTIVKELAQPVIIDERITTTIGPASLLRESEIYSAEFKQYGITEESRLLRFREWERLRREGYTDSQLDNHFTTQGWGPIRHYRFHELGRNSSNLHFSEQDRLHRFGEWQRLRGEGYTDSQLDNHFTTQGWGPINHYRFHELGNNYGNQYSNLNFNEEDRLYRFGEWERLRNQGYNDNQLQNHFTNQGWGAINNYNFHNLGSKHGITGSHSNSLNRHF